MRDPPVRCGGKLRARKKPGAAAARRIAASVRVRSTPSLAKSDDTSIMGMRDCDSMARGPNMLRVHRIIASLLRENSWAPMSTR